MKHETNRGNHYVKVTVDIPTKLTEKQKKLLEELAAEEGSKPSSGVNGEWSMEKTWDRIKSWLGQTSNSKPEKDEKVANS